MEKRGWIKEAGGRATFALLLAGSPGASAQGPIVKGCNVYVDRTAPGADRQMTWGRPR